MRNKIIALSLILSVVVCNLSGFEIVQAAKKTTLKTKTLSVNVGKTKSITLKNKSSKNKYTYKSSNKQVATVTKKGKVKGLKKGTTRVTITETIKAKKKTRKVGVCKVTVKSTNSITPIVTQLPTQVPINNATQVPNLIVTNSPEPTITESPTQMPKPTVVPAYETMNLEYDGTGVIPLTTAMIYGGLCTVSGTITQSSGSTQMVRVGYEGEYLNFTRNGSYISSSSVDPMSEYKEVEVTSGVEVPFTLVFELPKYSYDFNLQFVSDNSIDFNVKDLVMETKPFESAEYSKMVEESLSSSGNNARIKKAIEKARAGEDVTLAYIGGSITEGFAASETKNSDCYAETSYNQFKQTYGAGDGENVHFINAGMSGTPSTLGVIRYQRDVLDQMKHGTYPDVLFIDFAVNDGGDCGEAYESLIRTALEQGTAVVLMFVLYVNGCALETSYTQIGNVYDLTMVSPGTGMKSCVKSEFDDWFYWPNDGHPDVGGHRYMADCISNMFSVIDQEDTEDLAHDDLSAITPAKGISYVGMKTLESSTDISLLDSVKSITVGGFSGSDTSQPTLQYEKNGEKNMRWFPDAWAHTSSLGNDSFKAIIECNSILVAYKQSSSAFGTAECYLDGKKVATLNKSTGGWNNAQVAVILAGDEVKERTLEIKMASGDENKPFTIYAIGYANINE